MSKAGDRALEVYPEATRDIDGIVVDIGHPQYMRDLYIEGYHQAEKDLELTWEDMRDIYNLAYNLSFPHKKQKEFFEEVLKRFKNYRMEK